MPKESNKAVTVQDVSKRAGVSPITVSQVMNQKGRISDRTRVRVLEVARELGYVVSLRGGRSHLVGLLVPELTNPYFVEILRGASEALSRQGMDVVLYTSSYDRMRERERVQTLMSGPSDGLLMILPLESPEEIAALERAARPVVILHPPHPRPNLASVCTENFEGASQAMRHLLELGHRRIAYIGGQDGQDNAQRLRAYREALTAHGVALDPALIVRGDNSQPRGRQLTELLLNLPDPPTAVFAYNDFTAFGVIDAARVRGLRLPEDFSVIGVDDIPNASQVHPALTTVHHPLFHMGERAAEMLLTLIAGSPLPELHLELPSHLVVRTSTAPPRGTEARERSALPSRAYSPGRAKQRRKG
jgi:LacI family transcriptional regulator